MKKLLFIGIFFLIAVLSTIQALALTLEDIETAVIEQDFQKAQKLADEFSAATTDKGALNEAFYLLGITHLGLKEYAQARDVFANLIKSVSADKIRDKSYLGLIDAYILLEEYKEALDVVQKFKKVSPRSEFNSLIYLKEARAHLKLAHWEQANKFLKKIVNEFPDSLEVHSAKQLLAEERYFAVQVGSFIDRGRAELLVNELKQKDEYAYIIETQDRQERVFYRVRVGQLSRLDEAQKLKNKLSKLGYPTQIYP